MTGNMSHVMWYAIIISVTYDVHMWVMSRIDEGH